MVKQLKHNKQMKTCTNVKDAKTYTHCSKAKIKQWKSTNIENKGKLKPSKKKKRKY